MVTQCVQCGKTAEYLCSKCMKVAYCSKKCQQKLHNKFISSDASIEEWKADGNIITQGIKFTSNNQEITLDRILYTEEGKIALAGDFGQVYEGTLITKNEKSVDDWAKVIVKIFHEDGESFQQTFIQEIIIHQLLLENQQICESEKIVICAKKYFKFNLSEKETRFVIIYPFKEDANTLQEVLHNLFSIEDVDPEKLEKLNKIKRSISFNLLKDLSELHKVGIAHFDLKSDNVLTIGFINALFKEVKDITSDTLDTTLIDMGNGCFFGGTVEKEKYKNLLKNINISKESIEEWLNVSLTCQLGPSGASAIDINLQEDETLKPKEKAEKYDLYAAMWMILQLSISINESRIPGLTRGKTLKSNLNADFIESNKNIFKFVDKKLFNFSLGVLTTHHSKRKSVDEYIEDIKKL